MDEAAVSSRDLPKERITVMLAVLCHDLGKPLTTELLKGRIRSLGHDSAGLEPAPNLMSRLGLYTISGYDVRAQVSPLFAST